MLVIGGKLRYFCSTMRLEVFLPFISFIYKFLLYLAARKIRKLHIPLMTCAVAAGASILVDLAQLPGLLAFVVTIGFASVYVVRSSDAEIYPDGIGIPLAVEIVAAFTLSYAIFPLLKQLF